MQCDRDHVHGEHDWIKLPSCNIVHCLGVKEESVQHVPVDDDMNDSMSFNFDNIRNLGYAAWSADKRYRLLSHSVDMWLHTVSEDDKKRWEFIEQEIRIVERKLMWWPDNPEDKIDLLPDVTMTLNGTFTPAQPEVVMYIEVGYKDHQTCTYPVHAGKGWRIDNAQRMIVIGHGVPRTMIPLDNVQCINLVPISKE